MADRLSLAQTAELLKTKDDIGILLHRFPDGDTIGSGTALCRALRKLGKRAKLICVDTIPDKYEYMSAGDEQVFDPQWYCAVNEATLPLLGNGFERYDGKVGLCIDHHGTNTQYADNLLLDAGCAACAMIVAKLIPLLGVDLDLEMAEALYTGISTDTGCFRYSNTTAETLRMAADFVEMGVRAATINQRMFETKSRARIELERMALDGIEYRCNDRVAILTITQEMIRKSGACDGDLEGLTPLPRQIEGVWVGLTLRQKIDGSFKVSVRTGTHADASAICELLGGGGHTRASGCEPKGNREEVIEQLLDAIKQRVPRIS